MRRCSSHSSSCEQGSDALVKSQHERVDVAMTREWDKWNEFRVTKFLSKN